MIAVVMRHEAGWFDHRLVPGPRVVLGDLFGSRWSGWKELAPDREVIDGEHVDGYTITLERYDDPIEHGLLAELDTSAAVYADWLDEHDRPAFAEMLRLQLEAPKHHHLSREYDLIDRRLEQLAGELPEGWRHVAVRPLIVLGDELQFRIGTSRTPHAEQRTVQIWAGKFHLTPFDDTAYVPQFAYSVRRDRDAVTGAIATPPASMRLFDHGPTTDDMQCTARFEGDAIVLDVDVRIYPDKRPSLGVPRDDPPHHEQLSIRLRARSLVELFDEVVGALAI